MDSDHSGAGRRRSQRRALFELRLNAALPPATAERLDAVLTRQARVLDAKLEDISAQEGLETSHLRLRRVSDLFRVAVQLLGVLAAIMVAAAVVAVVWQAAHDRALVIEPISPPPDLAQRGLTGTVLATQLLDRLSDLQAKTDSARAPDSYRNDWSDDIKVAIPQTGVSVGEALRVLQKWLGHETHVTGEVYDAGREVVLTVRAGAAPGRSFRGPPDKLDTLMQQAAEATYAQTQPYRYSVYLSQSGRVDESLKAFEALALRGPPEERAWAFVGWGAELAVAGDLRQGIEKLHAGLALDPRLAAGWSALALQEGWLGHDEAALAAYRTALQRLRGRRAGLTPVAVAQSTANARASIAEATGDFQVGETERLKASQLAEYQRGSANARALAAIDLALAHDLSGLDDADRWKFEDANVFGPVLLARASLARATATDRWDGVAEALTAREAEARAKPGAYTETRWRTGIWPWRAYALARTGRAAEAMALAAATPADCYDCLRARGLIAATAGDRRGAEAWLARAVAAAPSLPAAHADLARVRLEGGDAAGAAAEARLAQARGPQWAEGYALAGRAALRLRGCPAARDAFAKAAKLAPAWSLPRDALARCPPR